MSFLKRMIIILLMLVAVMFAVPLILLKAAKPDAQLFFILMMFFYVNPVFCILLGVNAAKDIKHFWYTPLLVAVMFWIFSSVIYRQIFPYGYSALYFIICLVSMLITVLIHYVIKNKNKEK